MIFNRERLRSFLSKALKSWPVISFAVFLLAFVLVLSFSRKAPVIHSLEPRIARPGDLIVLKGEYFGTAAREGRVYLAGRVPTSSFIKSWSDDRIEIIVPDDAESGVVFVSTSQGRSDGVLFTNQNDIPIVLEGPVTPGLPFILSVEPARAAIGERLSISGRNFGSSRQLSSVAFALKGAKQDGKSSVPVLVPDSEIEEWSDQRVRIRIPTGASSGVLSILTSKGQSYPIPFELDESKGVRSFHDPVHYEVSQKITVEVQSSGPNNSLFLWIPLVTEDFVQRNLAILQQNQAPILASFNGMNLYRFENLVPGDRKEVELRLAFERYAMTLTVNSEKVGPFSDPESPFYLNYTSADGRLPLSDPRVLAKADYIGGDDGNPYVKGYRIFTYLLDYLEFEDRPPKGNGADALESRKASAWDYSLLFSAFARQAGIPARAISGYLAGKKPEVKPHFWAEFFVEGLGWIPVDLALADGLNYAGLPTEADPRKFYFGNTDNRHIAITKGTVQARQMDAKGRVHAGTNPQSFQTINDEAAGNLEQYTVDWGLLKIVESGDISSRLY